ncbi:hypothetical protein [Acidisoma silvae]|uniref:Mobilization protein n=1 Tax=Acidisoma silvae TaxID=2802396 RepID=A0A963YY73_9PROT|nr:hypothetical protein [Acidisoma silvae]MCB8878393.1 hypothetical protein [Acidisoma silvae]
MSKVTADQLAKLQQKADQTVARLQAAKARMAEAERKLDTRRKIIAGGLLFDAAAKDKQWAHHLAVLLTRIDRPNDKEPFADWTIDKYKAEGGKLGDRRKAKLAAADNGDADTNTGADDEAEDLTPGKDGSTVANAAD